MTYTTKSGHAITIERTELEVSQLTAPELSWRYIDPDGHAHRWTLDGRLATLVYVEDLPSCDEYPAISHYECWLCRAVVVPAHKANDEQQFVPGLARATIDGRSASREEVIALLRAEGLLG